MQATKKKNKKNQKQEQKGSFRNEIVLLCILTLCILLFISNFGVGGVVGKVISSAFFGLFGILAYLLPIVFFVGIAFLMSNKKNRVAMVKCVAGIVFLIFLCFLIELIIFGKTGTSPLESYEYAVKYKMGGGFVGGLLFAIFHTAFGSVGSYMITILILIICSILITERSFIGGIKKGSKKVYDTAREESIKYREQVKKKKVEQKRLQKDLAFLQEVSEEEGEVKQSQKIPAKKRGEQTQEKEIQLMPEFSENVMEKLFKPEEAKTFEEIVTKEKSSKEVEIKSYISENVTVVERKYVFPPIDLLNSGSGQKKDQQKYLQETALKLQQTLKNFGVNVTITDVSCGPSVTRYEIQPETGVKVSKIVNLTDDIKLNLAAPDVRMEAPIPGKAAIGIEVPNKETEMVRFRDMVESEKFQNHASSICFTVGKDIAGQVVVADIAKMPHLLIAGATGSGKSVCINTILMSILYKANPEEVKLILIDPKVVELSVYNGIPHLFSPVVTDPKKAAGALQWAVAEMMRRYKEFEKYNVRDLKSYNKRIETVEDTEEQEKPSKLPQIVIIVDELADLMMVAPGDVEEAICRLAQLARACGIHLILATQRPSVDVITGLIKANMPSRIAFSVSSGVDSRTILDMNGAEKLLGNGDMLYYPQGMTKPLRVQGPFVSDGEVEAVVEFLKKESVVVYNTDIEEKINSSTVLESSGGDTSGYDEYFMDAGRFVIEKEKGSIGMLQRWFKIGFNRAARIMDQLESAGVVGPEEGTKARRVLMTLEEFEQYLSEES